MVSANDVFIRYLTEAAGEENVRLYAESYAVSAPTGVRLNPYKKSPSFPDAEPVPWSPYGRELKDRPVFTLDPLFHSGCYYVQDSSSMFVGHVLRCMLGRYGFQDIRVLDLCAAPGGKTTDASSSLRNAFGERFFLVSNEVMQSRVPVLSCNAALWGDPNVAVTSADPSAFGTMDGFFDIIIADVPCSGEGMFRKDRNAEAQWSAANVELCAARQRRILADVWPALAGGGFLIYSTCTFNRYENDDNVRWAAGTLGAEVLFLKQEELYDGIFRTELGYSLIPGLVKGEGQYCAVLRKTSSEYRMSVPAARKGRHALPDISGFFDVSMTPVQKGDMLKAVPEPVSDAAAYLESHVRTVSTGCAVGRIKGRDLVPDADLALDIHLARGVFPEADVDRKTALAFLHRDSIVLPGAEKGFNIVCHSGVPVGFVKNLGNRCNNLHPQSRRIRMDV